MINIVWKSHGLMGKGKWRKPGRGGRYAYGPRKHVDYKCTMRFVTPYPMHFPKGYLESLGKKEPHEAA